MHVTKLHKEHICLRDIKVKSTNYIYVKARPKRMAAIDFLWFLVWQNFDLGSTVYISSQAFYAGVDPFDDFE